MKFLVYALTFGTLLGCATTQKTVDERSFSLRSYTEKTLDNGLRVLLVEDRTLPYVSFQMLVGGGTSADPAGMAGLNNFVSDLMDKGTLQKSAQVLADDLGRMGSEFSSSVSSDYSYLTASSLSSFQDDLLKVFAEIVTQPSFSPAEVERTRKLILAEISKQTDDPGSFSAQLFQNFLYGNHPYGVPQHGTAGSMRKIMRKNIIQQYLRFFRPNNSYLAVVGNYTPDIIEKLQSAFRDWKSRPTDPLQFPSPEKIHGLKVQLVDKPDLVQSQVYLGHFGIRRTNADFLSLRVASTILGGAFASRLNDRIRDDLGLTYSISSSFDARREEGPFAIATFTRNEKVGEIVDETLKVVRRFHSEGVSAEEVAAAKGLMKGVFPRTIETPERLAYNLLILRMYGIPDTYLSNFLDDVSRITPVDVNRVIAKYFDPDNMKILVYSNAQQAKTQLKAVGDIQVKSYKEF